MNRRLIIFALLLLTGLFPLTVSAQDNGVTFTRLTSATLPWDAVPSPDGTTIYYTAMQDNGIPGVFTIPAAGGESTVLAGGDPLVMPFGLDVSSDGKTLYVADPWSAGTAGNAIFALPTDGSAAPTVIVGTQNTSPQAVLIAGDQLYYTGIEIASGRPAIYKIAAIGAGDATIVAQGAPLIAPSGLAVTKDGVIYVLDRLASANGQGGVIRIDGDQIDVIASDVRIGGQSAGIALTLDESTALVSSLDNAEGTAQVLVINLATLETAIINDVIKANTAAGGLHRAHDLNVFAWIDSTPPVPGGRRGGIYGVIVGS